MKTLLILLLSFSFSMSTSAVEAEAISQQGFSSGSSYTIAKRVKKSKKKKRRKKRRRRRAKSLKESELTTALKLAKKGKYPEASKQLFRLSLSPKYKKQRTRIKYILGMMLFQMKLNQLSAFQFISVLKKGNKKYLRQSLEKLSIAADSLGDATLLNYAISRVKVESFPKSSRDMLYYRIGEYQMRANDFKGAARSFKRVRRSSTSFEKAKYLQGLSYAEIGATTKALEMFNDLYDSRANKSITDPSRVAAQVGVARTYYQRKKWDRAIETYRKVPRDTEVWHETLFESSWAMLRSGRFRSALSNFQTIHSSFYENFYLPESLLLRSIVYLYICKFDEMDKVLRLFNNIYRPVYKDVKEFLKIKDPKQYYNEVERMMAEFYELGEEEIDKSKFKLPFIVGRQIFKEGDYQRSRSYIKKLEGELAIIASQPSGWQTSSIGRYAKRVLQTRINKAQKKAGRQLRRHVFDVRNDLFDLFEQEGFIKFEMINGKKEMLKKKVAGKDLPSVQIDDDAERDYFIQNGYQYWPFQGEYWLDELGNYHYVGTQSCE